MDADLEHIAERDERHLVDEHAPRLHPRQHRAKGQLDFVIELFHAAFAQLPGQHLIERRDCRGLCQKRRFLRRLFSDLRFVRVTDLRAAILRENVVQLIIAPRRVQIISRKRRIKDKSVRREAALEKLSHQRLTVMRDLFDDAPNIVDIKSLSSTASPENRKPASSSWTAIFDKSSVAIGLHNVHPRALLQFLAPAQRL